MSQIVLTSEEKAQIIDALNKNLEPSADLLPKLFPLVIEKQDKFDVQALDRAKIPTLEYAGKRKKAAILAEAIAGIGAAPLQTVRCFGEVKDDEWKNLIVQGDNLQFLKTCYKDSDPLIKGKVKGKVKLIYIDPPFGTGDEYGGKQGEYSYSAKLSGSKFIESLRERVIFLSSLLDKDGFIFVRLDYHFGHYVKVMLDEILDKTNLRNEFIVNRVKKNVTNKGRRTIPIAVDNIYCYSKSIDSQFIYVLRKLKERREGYWHNMESAGFSGPRQVVINGTTYYPSRNSHFKYTQRQADMMISSGKIRSNPRTNKPEYWVEPKDYEEMDSNWLDIPGYTFTTGYPTENSETLLERVLMLASNPGDLIIDVFGGSGTTAAAAEKLGMRWITCDFGKHSIYTMQKRILRIAESKKLGKDIKDGEKYSRPPKPFCVVSSGAYDFEHIMDLSKNKNTYIDFVLALFQLTRDNEKSVKFRLTNIFSTKDTNPVEVYPVWDDNYLKDVRIDEIYLQNILDQAGSRLHGDYYIITPESCANIGDTTLPNQEGKNVTFHILSFPYKILEDISQKLVLEEQPSSASNINNLVTSTSFYFNEDVVIDFEKVDSGLKIKSFETKILDANRNRFDGLSGLAMILVDLNYAPGKPFDMDIAVYAKEIGEDGICKVEGLTPSVGVIAIDKHGNESKPFQIK